jgi:hypothetical protein
MTVPVGWLDPSQDCWDSNMLRRLLDGDLYPHHMRVRHHAGFPNADGAIVVLPGQYWHLATDQINDAIQRFEWVLLVRTADEEDLFDISKIEHPRVKFWVQTPRVGRDYGDARLFGVGFPPHANADGFPTEAPNKHLYAFLSAQNTHARRREAFAALEGLQYNLYETDGFTKGFDPDVYMDYMLFSRVAPCPSGAVSPDSFRAWEALEAHCVPILDAVSPVDGDTDYWEQVLPGCPAPVLRDYNDLPGYVEDALKGWPANANRITAYYMRYKRGLARGLREDLQALGAL